MNKLKLETEIRSIVCRYGLEQVEQALREIGRQIGNSEQNYGSTNRDVAITHKKRKKKITATEYVSKLEFPSEKKPAMFELADRFERKCFLPSFGDIANFCGVYGIDEPASKSRVSAIPRVFKFIVTMDTDKIQRILDEEMFSGPSGLGPIADAIRENGRSNISYTPTIPPAVLDSSYQRLN